MRRHLGSGTPKTRTIGRIRWRLSLGSLPSPIVCMFWIAFYITILRHNEGCKLGQDNTISLSRGASIDRPHNFLCISALIVYFPFLMTPYLTAIHRRERKVRFKCLHDCDVILIWIFFR